jgi:four helix bundle protein
MASDTTTQSFSSDTPDHRDTFLYRQAMVLATECFQLARQLPEDERFNLFAEILQASVAIPANIAGAHEAESHRQRLHHFDVARGKVKRLQTLLIMAVRVDCVERAATTRARLLANEIDGWLRTLIRQLARRH